MKSILLCLFLLAAFSLNGQNNQPTELTSLDHLKKRKIEFIIGPSLLYPIVNWAKKNDDPRRIMYGCSFGIGIPKIQLNRFELTTRLLWERKGYATKYSNADSAGNLSEVYNKQKFNYYSLLIMPSYFLGEHKRIKVIAGAYLSLLAHDAFEQKAFLNGKFTDSYFVNNVKGRFKRYDYGVSIGVSHSRPINRKIEIGLQLLGNLGMVNIVPSKFVGVVIKPCSLSLSLILTYKH